MICHYFHFSWVYFLTTMVMYGTVCVFYTYVKCVKTVTYMRSFLAQQRKCKLYRCKRVISCNYLGTYLIQIITYYLHSFLLHILLASGFWVLDLLCFSITVFFLVQQCTFAYPESVCMQSKVCLINLSVFWCFI